MKNEKLKVVSASRRVDMISCYPDLLYETLRKKTPPEKVHTLVIWTKNPENILTKKYLKNYLKQYSQLFILVSITGMGNTVLEPNIPGENAVIQMIPDLIKLTESPARISVRFDPIVHLRIKDAEYCNLDKAEHIIKTSANFGIKRFITSWMSEYKKVRNNLAKLDIDILEVSDEKKIEGYRYLDNIVKLNNAELNVCSSQPFKISRCIDGFLYNSLHPEGLVCSTNKAKGQREHCGCTESWDIGWYYPCFNGCIYCYANPKINAK